MLELWWRYIRSISNTLGGRGVVEIGIRDLLGGRVVVGMGIRDLLGGRVVVEVH